MTEDKDFKYYRCSNCGRYFINEQEEGNKFCSEECKTYFKSCRACGNYFTSSRTDNGIFCSMECGTNPETETPHLEQDLSLLHHQQTLSVDNQ
jgi:hypothetical protein